MTWLNLYIKPLGPLRFRGPGEFSPMSKGPITHGLTLHYPLPSTIAGALCSSYYSSVQRSLTNCDPDTFECLSRCLSELLGDAYALRPGYLTVDHVGGGRKLYAAIFLGKELYVEERSVDRMIREIIKMIAEKHGLERKFEPVDFLRKIGVEHVEPAKREFIGISLEYGRRIVREGYIYRASDLDLYSSFNKIPVSGSGIDNRPLEAYVTVNMYTSKDPVELTIMDDWVQTIGGERYPAKLMVRSEWEPHWPDADMNVAGILLEPALIEIKGIKSSLTLGEAYRQLAAKTKGFTIQAVISPFSKIGIIVPGYTLKENRLRKPYLAIPRGSIILGHGSPAKLYRDGVGYASSIGWGTVHPVPIKDDTVYRRVIDLYQ